MAPSTNDAQGYLCGIARSCDEINADFVVYTAVFNDTVRLQDVTQYDSCRVSFVVFTNMGEIEAPGWIVKRVPTLVDGRCSNRILKFPGITIFKGVNRQIYIDSNIVLQPAFFRECVFFCKYWFGVHRHPSSKKLADEVINVAAAGKACLRALARFYAGNKRYKHLGVSENCIVCRDYSNPSVCKLNTMIFGMMSSKIMRDQLYMPIAFFELDLQLNIFELPWRNNKYFVYQVKGASVGKIRLFVHKLARIYRKSVFKILVVIFEIKKVII